MGTKSKRKWSAAEKPQIVLDRIAARLAAVPLASIADRTLTPGELSRVKLAIAALEPVAARLAFLNPPYSREHVAAAGTGFDANVVMLDYIKRFTVRDGSKDKREALETSVDVLRRFCDAGPPFLWPRLWRVKRAIPDRRTRG